MDNFETRLHVERFEQRTTNGSILITPTLKVGRGDMVAPDLDTESLIELAHAVDSAQRPIEDEKTADCFDPRGLVSLGDGTHHSEAKVRARMAGADALTGFAMVELLPQRWSAYPRGVERMSAQQRFGFFISRMRQFSDPGAHGPKCGAAVGFPTLVENHIALFDEISSGMAETMEEHYDPAVHAAIREAADRKLEDDAFKGWDPHWVTDEIAPTSHTFQHLDNSGLNNGYAPLLYVVNLRRGTSLHKPSFTGPDGSVLQAFQQDAAAVGNLAHNLANSEEEFISMIHIGMATGENAVGTLASNVRTVVLK